MPPPSCPGPNPTLPPGSPAIVRWKAAPRKARASASFIELAHAEVHAVTRATWLPRLREVLVARRIDKLLVAAGTPHGDAALDELPRQGIDCPTYDLPIEAWKTEMFTGTPASLTTARAAIAETGTLILWPDAHEPRLMSLVPPVHIVLLDAKQYLQHLF
jgi:L-lactate dehydrogenase complex protein LldG